MSVGSLAKLDGTSDRVSWMAVAIKRIFDVRICIDPKQLNEALRSEQFMLPVSDDLICKLVRTKCFTNVDLASGLWHLELDYKSVVY